MITCGTCSAKAFALPSAVCLAIAISFALWSTAPLDALSANVVISQVYGGGGNAGATLTNDFIELYNRGAIAVNLSGWSVQYASATGTGWQVTPLTNFTLQPGQYYLIQEAQGAGGTAALPTPDASGAIAMSATAGKVALLSATTVLVGTGCPGSASIVDFVGYGPTANCSETGPAPAPSNTTADLRQSGGCTETDSNSNDFAAGAPNPRNSAQTSACVVTPPPLSLAIHDIQGPGNISPHAGETVMTTGIVTGLKMNGFFIQTPDAEVDADPNTSEGVFVFTSSAPPTAAAVGNLVTVTGKVQEFVPAADSFSPSTTEIAGSPSVTLISVANPLPVPITLTASDTQPLGGLFQLEKYEGMRVHIDALTVVGPTGGSINETNASSTSDGVFYGVISGIPRPFREAGVELPDPLPAGAPATVPRWDGNPERVRVDSDAQPGATKIDVTSFATVTNLTGPLDYGFRAYTVLPDPGTPPAVTGNIAAIPVLEPNAHEFTIASFNMERFFDTVDDPGLDDVALTAAALAKRLAKASLAIRNVLRTPDIIGVEEMENLTTLQAIASQVGSDANAAGQIDPQYQAILLEGNDIGGIDVGFLIKKDRVIFDDYGQIGKDTTFTFGSSTTPLNDRPSLWVHATVLVQGAAPLPITVIVNHLRSLSGIDDPADGARVRAKRHAQAEELAGYVQALQTANPLERIVLLGDFNAFQVNDGYVDVLGTIIGKPAPPDQVVLASADLVNPDLVDLVNMAPTDQRYSFVFDGTAQELDHVLVTGNVQPLVSRFAYARNDADFPEIYRNDATRPERISDHDMVVAYFALPFTPTVTYTGATMVNVGTTLTLAAHISSGIALVPTGSVTFTFRGTSVVASLDALGNASAAIGTVTPPIQSESVTIAYAGDANFSAATTKATVQVVDTIAPVINAISATPPLLGRPNHKLVPVNIDVNASDNADLNPACSIAGVSSNEPKNGTGDGSTSPDWELTGPLTLKLRAERSGHGTGRIYTIVVTCTDGSRNASSASTTVLVPKGS
jgi:predicted extracellular nuclease